MCYPHTTTTTTTNPHPTPQTKKKKLFLYNSNFFYNVESHQGRALWAHPWEVNYVYTTPLTKIVNQVIQGYQGRALYNSNYEILKEKGIHA